MVTLAVVGLLGRSTWGVYSRMQEASVLRHNAEAERDELETRQAELEVALERLDTPRGQEEEIRKRFPLVKPGEEEFVLVDQPVGASTSAKSQEKGTWEWFLDLF